MPPTDLPVPPPYPNVTYSQGAINHLHGGVVIRATETLREVMGPDFDAAEITWSASLDDRGQPIYTLTVRVPAWQAVAERSFTADEIGAVRVPLYRLWSQMLRNQVDRLLVPPTRVAV